jgi:NAD(P)H-flavin reductase
VLPPRIKQLLDRDNWLRRGRKISFFTGPSPEIAAIARRDRNAFRHLAVVIARTNAAMERLRAPHNADKFPRAFFLSLEELVGHAIACRSTIASFTAEILTNIPVGDSHYQLAFRAPELRDLRAPQFFMMDAKPQRTPLGSRSVCRREQHDAVDWTPQPLLKRPFGICRDFHPHFPADYLKHLALPPSLAPFLHLPAPDHFDMLYKVLPDGIGTPMMARLKRGDRVHMIGPLGQPFDVRALRAAGVGEVHVVGGGVGMAPLITLIEALRFHGIRLKVFLGIATLESLRYRDELAATFGEKPRDAYTYVDDLLAAGVPARDIFLSFDRAVPRRVRTIPRENLFLGLVPEQYRNILATCHPERSEGPRNDHVEGQSNSEILRSAQNDSRKKIVAFTCGPNRMMEMMAGICQRAGIPLKVLLEKRMGCGIGVCFSCVQKVRRADGSEDYVRVCKDGPVFDAKDIVWNNNSTPPSASCGCAPRC